MQALNALFHGIGDVFGAVLHPFVLVFANLLIGTYHLIAAVHLPYPFAISIIIVTLLLKFVTYPLMAKQLRHQKKIMELSPKVNELKKLHKEDQKKFFTAQQQLYKENGISQVSGCLPSLIQLPFLYGVYILLNKIVVHPADMVNYINSLVLPPLRISHQLDIGLFGISLGKSPSSLMSVIGAGIILVPVITAFLTFIQSKMMSPTPVKEYKSDSPKEKKEKQESADMAMQMQGQMMFLLPLMIGYSSFIFPLGLALYWNVSTIFGIIQQYKITGPGGLTPIWQKITKLLNK